MSASPPDPHHFGQQGRGAFPMGRGHLPQARRRARFPAGVCLARAGHAGVPDGAERRLAVQNVVCGLHVRSLNLTGRYPRNGGEWALQRLTNAQPGAAA